MRPLFPILLSLTLASLLLSACTGTPAANGESRSVKSAAVKEQQPRGGSGSPTGVPAAESDGSVKAESAAESAENPQPADKRTVDGSAPPQGATAGEPGSGKADETAAAKNKRKTSAVPGHTGGKTELLSERELLDAALDLLPDGRAPLTRDERPLSVTLDMNADGLKDIALLTIPESAAGITFKNVSDFSRLFKESSEPCDFELELYEQTRGTLRLRETVPLGRQPVIESFALVPLSAAGELPAAVSTGFLTPQGGEREWVIFSPGGEMSRMTLHESPTRKSRSLDLDDDGMLDILLQEKVAEAGTGYETFLTWYRWAGESYREYRTTNVVRNLNAFLKNARETLVTRGYPDFLEYAVSSGSLEPGNAGQAEQLDALFVPSIPGYEENELPAEQNLLTGEKRIVDITFPEISENPFSLEGENGYTFNLPLRLVFEDGEYYFFRARIRLTGNPFSERQFTFTTCR